MQPDVSDGRIKEIVERNFGLTVGNIHRYAGYSDLNYRIEIVQDDGVDNETTGMCRILVLKILNHDDSRYPECFGECMSDLQCTGVQIFYYFVFPLFICFKCNSHAQNLHGYVPLHM